MASPGKSENLYAIVDMGSNGVRFSISDISPPTARVMPTVFQSRAAISLYDAQHDKSGASIPIPDKVLEALFSAFYDFDETCSDFGVPKDKITLVATEATRTAQNGQALLDRVKKELGWATNLLAKEEEGRTGALGVASSFESVNGFVMDLGGGSTQLSWVEVVDGELKFSESGSVSLPLGAAALSSGLKEAEAKGAAQLLEYQTWVQSQLKDAYEKITANVDAAKPDKQGEGISLYLSGGGFRGWGYILMNRSKVKPYPIPIINGFVAAPKDFKNANAAEKDAKDDEIFRVSDRRADQVPAVGFLVRTLSDVIPKIKDVRFAQGGVREGRLFDFLDKETRAMSPLNAATAPSAPPSAKEIEQIIRNALPGNQPAVVDDIITGFVNLLYSQRPLPKESQAAAALRSTTSGVLAGVHGLIHEQRSALALSLCERWGAEVAPTDTRLLNSVRELVGAEIDWWTRYLGRVGALVGDVYPSGIVKEKETRVVISSSSKKKGIGLTVDFTQGRKSAQQYAKDIKNIEKVGKKKNWIGGKDGWGMGVEVIVDPPIQEESKDEEED